MIIIFDGMVEVYTEMDNKQEFIIDHLPKGSIINPHTFLVNRQMPVSARFVMNTTFYSLSAERFGDIAAEYYTAGNPSLHKVYNLVYTSALASKERGDNGLDYVSGKNDFYFGPGTDFMENEEERIK